MTASIDRLSLPLRARVAIEEGRSHAIRVLAKQYSQGIGVRKNRRVAFALYEAGAELRDAEMAWLAADALEYGLGVSKSPADAERYLKLAADLGSVGATSALGEYRWRSARTDVERRDAIALYRRAAKHGEPHALHNLGVCYSSGLVVRKNLRLAFEKFFLAARRGHTEAMFKLGWCLLNGEGVLADRRRAIRWLRRAANSGHLHATQLLSEVTGSLGTGARGSR